MNFTESALIQQSAKMLAGSGRILKGERPADLGPAGDKSRAGDQPKALGLEVPPDAARPADKVIE